MINLECSLTIVIIFRWSDFVSVSYNLKMENDCEFLISPITYG